MKLYRYIWNEWIKVFLITGCLVVGLIVIQEVYSRLNGWIEKGATWGEIIFLFLLKVPLFLPSIIPIVLLLSVLFSIGVMHRKNEIVAMRAAGISLWKISQPLMFAAFVLAGTILYLDASFVPWSVETQSDLETKIHERRVNAESAEVATEQEKKEIVRNLGYLNFHEQRLWLMGNYDPFLRRGEEVTVYQMDEKGREVYRIRAAHASYDAELGSWSFEKGRELFFDGESEEPYRNRGFETLLKPDVNEDPQIMIYLRKKPQDLSLFELRRVIDAYEGFETPAIVPYEVRYFRNLLSPLICFLVVGFGVPFAASGVRTNPMIGISKAVGLFVLYFIVSNISTIMGDAGVVEPFIAAGIPLIFIGAVAVRVFVKAQ